MVGPAGDGGVMAVVRTCDLAVVGSGPGGYAAALTAARRGVRVCLIEREQWGGVCLNVGCIPTKALVTVAHLMRRLGQAHALGIALDGYRLEYATVRARNERIVSELRRGLTGLLRQEGVELVSGRAAFEDPHTLVITQDGVSERLEARWIVLATGACPHPGPWTMDEQRMLSYRGLLALSQLPASLLIIGGGVIGCEFASCFSAFGTRITLVEQQPQLLPMEDPEAVRWVARRLEQQGVALHTGTTVTTLTASERGVRATLSTGTSVEAERCLVAIGQQPNIGALRLANGSVAHDVGVTVDAFLRTSQPHIAAIGDCLAGHGLAHWASAEGALAVRNLLGDPPAALDPTQVPRCVFSDPELAHVGVRETDQGGAWRVSRFAFGALGKSSCDEETEGFVKLVVDPATEQVRGVTIVGAQASNLIHQAVMAIQHGLTARQLARTITAHPTLPEAVTEAAAHLYGESLAVASRSRRPLSGRTASPAHL